MTNKAGFEMIQNADLLKLIESASTNNGDALSLAIELGITISPPPCNGKTGYALAEWRIDECSWRNDELLKVDVINGDCEAATRLAICEAAKKIMATRDE